MIPKRIFYAWFGPNQKSDKLVANIEHWKLMNPDYEVIEINEHNFDVSSYTFTSEAYNQNMWAFVSDVARLEFVYKYGGFYFDVDVEMLRPLDELRVYNSVWALENTDAIASGLVVGGNQSNEQIGDLLAICKDKKFNSNNLRSHLCIPIVTDYFLSKGFKRKNKKQLLENNCMILPTCYFAPLHMWGGGKVSSKTIGVHHYAASWLGGNGGLTLKGRMVQVAKYYCPPVSVLYNFYKKVRE